MYYVRLAKYVVFIAVLLCLSIDNQYGGLKIVKKIFF